MDQEISTSEQEYEFTKLPLSSCKRRFRRAKERRQRATGRSPAPGRQEHNRIQIITAEVSCCHDPAEAVEFLLQEAIQIFQLLTEEAISKGTNSCRKTSQENRSW